MKIIYKKQTGVLVSTTGEFGAPYGDEDVAEVPNFPMDKLPRYYKYNGDFVAPRHPSEVDAEMASEKFSVDAWISAMISSLGVAKVKSLGAHFTLLQWMVGQKKWKEIAELLVELVKDGDVTQDEANKIELCFRSQGVDIKFFSPPAPTPPIAEDK